LTERRGLGPGGTGSGKIALAFPQEEEKLREKGRENLFQAAGKKGGRSFTVNKGEKNSRQRDSKEGGGMADLPLLDRGRKTTSTGTRLLYHRGKKAIKEQREMMAR